MDQYFKRLERLLSSIEGGLRQQQDGCTIHKDLLLEIEKVRGEMRAMHERQRVHEGMVIGQFTRMHERLDSLHTENTGLREQLNKKDLVHSSDISKIKMHLRYVAGGFAALLFLLSFFEKIRDFFSLLLGSNP